MGNRKIKLLTNAFAVSYLLLIPFLLSSESRDYYWDPVYIGFYILVLIILNIYHIKYVKIKAILFFR